MEEDKSFLEQSIELYLLKNKLSPILVAKLMNKSPQFVRLGLQKGILPIGNAIKNGKWSYYISPKLFENYTGIDTRKEAEKLLNEIKG